MNEDREAFRESLRRFCEDKVLPRAAEIDASDDYPWDVFEACTSMELPALAVPEEYGGAGADSVTFAIMIEELARVSASVSLTLNISPLAMIPVKNWGSDDLKRRYLPRIASGEWQGSYCLSEAGAGSDAASLATRAERDGDVYVLTGTKMWITNAGVSDVYVVFAKTDPAARSRGISAFVVEKEWGVRFGTFEHKLGMRGSPTGEVIFDGVRVPVENRIGDEGEGFRIAMETLNRSRPTIGAQAVGIAQGAIDASIAYMKEREQFGKPIAEFQGLQFMLADMAMRTEAARALVYRACEAVDAGAPSSELAKLGAMAKCFASDVAMEATTNAVQIHAGVGYTKEYPVERMMRDAKVTQIYEGTNQIQRVVMARELLS